MIHQASPVGEILRRLRAIGRSGGLTLHRRGSRDRPDGTGTSPRTRRGENLSLEMACRFAFVHRVARPCST